jgi:hypothetical protein
MDILLGQIAGGGSEDQHIVCPAEPIRRRTA